MSKEELEQHSPLGPSSADRWINCPGSVKATEGMPDTSSEFAAEGTFAHLVSEVMRKGGYGYGSSATAKDMIGFSESVAGFSFTVDQAMADYVEQFVDYVADHEYDEQLIEARVTYDAWVDGGFGTLDAGLLNDGTCVVVDLKYGKGIQVFAEDNSQLKMYALGMYQQHSELYDIQDFKLVIHQPRLNHVDEWSISLPELVKWADEVVEPAADAALGDDAPFAAGSWCQWCKIKGTCKVRAEAYAEEMLDDISDVRNPAEMDDAEMGEVASVVPLIAKWCKDVMAAVEKRVAAGSTIIGADTLPFKLVEGRSNRGWRDAAEAEKSMRSYKVKVGDMFTRKLIGVPAAEKLLGKGHPMIVKHVVKPKGKPVLVPGSDKREQYQADISELKVVDDE